MEKGNIKNLKELIDLFEHNIKQYKGKHYDEAKARADFIDKFFMLLGWDIYNEKDYSEQYRDVVREDRVEIKGKVKAPDYSFRIGGFRKFFVEAKKPSVNIKHDIEPAFQLRRYAYTAKLPLSILTDFEEFAVYDTRIKPDKHDQASTARIFYCTYKEYEKEFDFIFNTFSREAILKGSFDQYIEDTKRKKGTSEVDKEFLKLIEKWREDLAKNIALRNKNLTIYELNYAVQKIIDRIIFLRIAEDRDVEDYGKIQKLLENKKTIYPQLVNLFLKADVKYDSGLFNFKADQVTPELKIDDKILKDIIKSIYYPDSPYEFSVFDVEILGNIYEQFLGKTIRLTASHQAKIENKPEVKKAGGVYYTPKYIVDYIVKNTVGEIVGACGGVPKTPKEIEKIKILDPACGSGSFLLGAYQMLMNYHLEYYTKDKNIKKSLKENKIYQIKENEYRLTIEEKHRILLNNIFGVDIDSQAVEVTKLSLLLKLMEGESQESAGMLFKFSDIKMLPDLSENIKCGNSLIGSDFYETAQMSLFQDEETSRRINVFDWPQEFPDIFTQGGFDIVIGNPPYIRIQNMKEYAPDEVEFFKKNYKSASKGSYDIYVVFVEKGLNLLSKKGILGFILPSKFFTTDYGLSLRKLITENNALYKIVDFGYSQVFENATTYTNLLFLNRKPPDFVYYSKISNPTHVSNNSLDFRKIDYKNFLECSWTFASKNETELIEKIISNSTSLIELPSKIGRGSSSGNDKIFIIHEKGDLFFDSKGNQINVEKEILRKPIYSTDFGRYHFKKTSKDFIIFPYYVSEKGYNIIPEKDLKRIYPKTYRYLLDRKKILIQRKQYTYWYGFSAPRNLDVHESAQMLVPLLAEKGSFSNIPINSSEFCLMASGGFSITIDTKCNLSPAFILGLLNSKLLFWRLNKISNKFRGGWITCTKQYVGTLPIKKLNIDKLNDKNHYNKIVKVVNQMLEVQKKYQSIKIETEKIMLKKQIDILDNQIDKLVYKLYNLTEEEIRIVEIEK